MRYDYSSRLRDDISSAVQAAFKAAGIVNITVVAEQVRIRNLDENVALEDVEHLVLQAAQLIGAAIEFDGLNSGMTLLVDDDNDRAIAPLDLSGPVSIQ